jgi:hypothetical protein
LAITCLQLIQITTHYGLQTTVEPAARHERGRLTPLNDVVALMRCLMPAIADERF